ncbi:MULTISPECIES: major capsid protein [Peribacillus]|uniref:major capsid protein n=1 Tax=Peribacillus TaxID=2675229 RepID=UPI001F4D814B|nr:MULTISPECIES: major capsid protein [unclassified Peribacillus]MCK1982224.1 major capsid protein [Peribacillus sp. Aquil_B1]MCK2007424.1 major capsid protein [Peribacillus sp. Aquil_B8]
MAGITHLEEFQKPALQALVDITTEEAPLSIADEFIPTVTTFNRRFAYDIIENNNFIAEYMGYGAEPPVVDRNAIASKAGEIAYFGLKHIMTYEELQALNEARNDAEHRAAIDATTVTSVDLVKGSLKLIQLAKMEALTKGRFEAQGNIKVAFNYDIPAENKKVWTTGADLDTVDFDVVGGLMAEVDKYVALNGQLPEVMWISREIQARLLRNQTIIAEAGRESTATRVSVEQLNGVLDTYGLPPIRVIQERTTSYKDNFTGQKVVKEFMPANRIVMLGKGRGNEYKLGPTLENNFKPGIYMDAYDKKEPIQSVIRTVGAGFPILETPSLIHHIDAFTIA